MTRKIDPADLPEFDLAEHLGIEALYKALRPGASPRFETVSKVCRALGVKLVAQPLHPA